MQVVDVVGTIPLFPFDPLLRRGCITFFLLRFQKMTFGLGAKDLYLINPSTGTLHKARTFTPAERLAYMAIIYSRAPSYLLNAIHGEMGHLDKGKATWAYCKASLDWFADHS